jgi:UDP-N-acetylmuramoylalanine--D-glutamate ligase
VHAETLENALRKAHAVAESGDVVLLAPACASFDQFKNYEQRGQAFKEIVRGLG